jgi:hypothetical protein
LSGGWLEGDYGSRVDGGAVVGELRVLWLGEVMGVR